MRIATILGAAVPLLWAAVQANAEPVSDRLKDAATTFADITAAKDKGIPEDLLDKAHCVAIVPSLKKGAFVFGGEYGKGFIACRKEDRKWSAPGAVIMTGGSFGFQIGGSETDVVMLVMNDHGAEKLLKSQFTLGADGEVAAGPVGRNATAQTDAKLSAEILSWSRSRGVFAGISLKGATLRQDLDANQVLYGKRLDNREIVTGSVKPTDAGGELIAALDHQSPVEHPHKTESDPKPDRSR